MRLIGCSSSFESECLIDLVQQYHAWSKERKYKLKKIRHKLGQSH